MSDEKEKEKDRKAEQERARRLEETIRKGPQAPRSPHEFIEEKMREERRKRGETEPADR